jgi:hypothetical protein
MSNQPVPEINELRLQPTDPATERGSSARRDPPPRR